MPKNKRKFKQGGGLLMSEAMLHSISDDEVREKVLEEERRLAEIREDARKQAEAEVIGKLPGGSGPPSWAISLLAKFLGRDDPTKDSSNERKSNKGGGLLDSGGSEAAPAATGAALLIPTEQEQDMPVDTYPNIPPEEEAAVEASQVPDEKMEEDYIEFIIDESLEDEEQTYLMSRLEDDPQLSQIFDKVVGTASEFSGSGSVEGPGTGVSDSIPARLSEGEFVFTDKATEQLGADNLQKMMDDAERAYDGGLMRKALGGIMSPENKKEGGQDEEIKKAMVSSNRMPSLRQ